MLKCANSWNSYAAQLFELWRQFSFGLFAAIVERHVSFTVHFVLLQLLPWERPKQLE